MSSLRSNRWENMPDQGGAPAIDGLHRLEDRGGGDGKHRGIGAHGSNSQSVLGPREMPDRRPELSLGLSELEERSSSRRTHLGMGRRCLCSGPPLPSPPCRAAHISRNTSSHPKATRSSRLLLHVSAPLRSRSRHTEYRSCQAAPGLEGARQAKSVIMPASSIATLRK